MTTTGEKIVFTNGCFDILHPGHVQLLESAAKLGTRLIVGINSDASVRNIKGQGRPIQDQEARKAILLGLSSVNEVIIFEENTPARIIAELKPDVLVKGGDWPESEIVGADEVKANGGEVVTIPLVEGHSTSQVVERIRSFKLAASDGPPTNDVVLSSLEQHRQVFSSLDHAFINSVKDTANLLVSTFKSGGKVLVCGNGGSAADSQHLAAEFVGRYESERISLPAIALTTDTSALTAIANDYSFDRVYSRQVESLATAADCLIAISTSGNSLNIIEAVMTARRKGIKVIGLTGEKGKRLASLCDECVIVPSARTARIQEMHITIAHIWCEVIDAEFTE